MINIRKLIPPENLHLFPDNPELNTIWEIPALQNQARESYEEWGLIKTESTGEIFSINENGVPIGIIGWFEYDEVFPDVLRLRYYGIVPSRRGRGYGEEAMRLLLDHLARSAPPRYSFLAESVTLCRAVAPSIIAHFKRMGFVEFDDPNYGSNAGCGKALSLKIRIPSR